MAITTITMRVIMQTDKKRPFIHMDITKMGTSEEIYTDITKRLTPENTNSIIHTTITPTAITRKVILTRDIITTITTITTIMLRNINPGRQSATTATTWRLSTKRWTTHSNQVITAQPNQEHTVTRAIISTGCDAFVC